MLQSTIHRYFQIHKLIFENNFKAAVNTFQEGAIHDMRVSIKRLRLLYKLINFCFDENFEPGKRAKYLKKVFKSAAGLRDVQIQKILIEDIEIKLNIHLNEAKSRLQKQENIEIAHLKAFLSKFNYIKLEMQFQKVEKTINAPINYSNTEIYEGIRKYFHNRISMINQLLNKDIVDYHKIRKRIKELAYLLEIQYINTENASGKLEQLKQMGKQLGDWHDIEVFLKTQVFLQDNKVLYYLKEQQTKLLSGFKKNYELFLMDKD